MVLLVESANTLLPPLHRSRPRRGVFDVLCVWLALLAVGGAAVAQNNALSDPQVQKGWILLFDGGSTFGWTAEGGAHWSVVDGTIRADSGPSGYLRTNIPFTDFHLTCDFMIGVDGESGIFLRLSKHGDPQEMGHKLQIDNSDPDYPTGSLVGEIKALNAGAAPNQWHTYDVLAVGDHFVIKLDGKQVLSGDTQKRKVGYIGLQFVHGTPVAFRNIKLKPLGLVPLFNRHNLYGWVQGGVQPSPKKKGLFGKLIPGQHSPKWSVKDGAIHVDKGPSELQSDSLYDDFILQLRALPDTHSKHQKLRGGVYVRTDKTVEGTGYKVEIQYGPPPGGLVPPVGEGIGGLASIQSARIVPVPDSAPVVLTVAARGHHLATWVNGYQTVDYQDSRPDGPDALIQARTTPGPIGLAADTPASSLDFEDIRVATLPKAGVPAFVAASQPLSGEQGTTRTPTSSSSANVPSTPPAAVPLAAPAGNPHEQEISRLEQEALASSDPAKQIEIYNRILALDPNNLVAFDGRKDAQTKLDQMKAEEARDARQKETQEAKERHNEEQAKSDELTKDELIQKAEKALLAGDLSTAAALIARAKQIAPNDPKVLDLDERIGHERQSRRRERLVWIGGGSLLALLVLFALARTMIGEKQPYLEVVDGVSVGKRYVLDGDVVHIGAVAQDGGRKNEIVVTDVGRSISRFHCEIHRKHGKFWLLDCKSSNGTFLNGQRVQPEELVRLKKAGRVRLADACTFRLGVEKRKSTSS